MGTVLLVLIVALTAWIVWKLVKSPDHNEDGKVDLNDVKSSAMEVAQEVKSSLDVNKDGKVDLADVKAAGEKAVKKVAARKPRAKKVK